MENRLFIIIVRWWLMENILPSSIVVGDINVMNDPTERNDY